MLCLLLVTLSGAHLEPLMFWCDENSAVLESQLHEQFAEHRVVGEWFTSSVVMEWLSRVGHTGLLSPSTPAPVDGEVAMYEYGPVYRQHYAASRCGGTNAVIHKKLMRQWYGLRAPETDADWYAYACPHILTANPPSDGMSHRCYAQWFPVYRDIWDHARLWYDSEGTPVITLEPWGSPITHADMLTCFTRELSDIGIVTAFEGRSPYGASYVLFLAGEHTGFGGRMFTGKRVEVRL